jgi:hypothetical protein
VTDAEVRLVARRACERSALSGSVVDELVTAVEAEIAYIDEDRPSGARPAYEGTREAAGW